MAADSSNDNAAGSLQNLWTMESGEEKVIKRATIFRVGDERRMARSCRCGLGVVGRCLLFRCTSREVAAEVLLKQLIMKDSTAACSPTVSLLIFYITKQSSNSCLILGKRRIDLDLVYIRLINAICTSQSLFQSSPHSRQRQHHRCTVVPLRSSHIRPSLSNLQGKPDEGRQRPNVGI